MPDYSNILIATDLDGTLYENQNNIPRENLDAIRYFTENGGHFAIATGRGIEAARVVAEKLPTKTPSIVNNGHTLFGFANDKFIANKSLPDTAKITLSKILDKYNVAAEIYSGKDLYVINPNKALIDHLTYEKVNYNNTCISDIFELKWNKVLITDQKKDIDIVRKELENQTFDGFDFVDTSSIYVEMVIKGVTKGTALCDLAEYLNIPLQNTYSIGNFYNDIGLLQSAAHSAVVKDTPKDVAIYADYICERTADGGAVAEYIQKIIGNDNLIN